MNNQTISLISTNRRKFSFYDKLLRMNFPDIKLINQNFEFKQSRSLDEFEIAKDRTEQALKFFKPPFLIDQEGFYLECFSTFPGVLSSQVTKSIGWKGILKISGQQKLATLFCHISFVDSAELINIFREETDGYLTQPEAGNSSETIYDHFVPKGQKMTLTQLESAGELQAFFPRYRAILDMVRSKVFIHEFSKIKKTVLAVSRTV